MTDNIVDLLSISYASDKNVLDALKWTNENKSKLIDGNDTCVDEKKSENGGCSDSSNPAAEQETTNPKEKVNIYISIYFVSLSKLFIYRK